VPEGDRKNDRVKHLHGHKVTGIEEKGDKILVRYETSDAEKGAMEADLVIGADGPSSTVRSLLMPGVERTYAGYVALRGTVLKEEASPEAQKVFSERFVFHHQTGIQILAYLIPGANGTLEPGKRLINFVYYTNVASPSLTEPSPEFRELMTDVDGRYHRITMPPGKFDPKAWAKQCEIAKETLPPQFAELVCRTKKPFIQAVTDVISPTNELMNGRVILLGDALAGFRPHTTASTSQACFDAMMLADLIDGKVSKKEWKKQVMGFAKTIQQRGLDMGRRSQFEDLPLEEHIKNRNLASRLREREVWPEWAVGDVE
jgi:2-polyprenyl-6-methoxyphenol hydroxylase-like FAD-dependent oxidoreductase